MEAVLRKEYLDEFEQFEANLYVAKRLIPESDTFHPRHGFGAYNVPLRDIEWLITVKRHILMSFGQSISAAGVGLWEYDLECQHARRDPHARRGNQVTVDLAGQGDRAHGTRTVAATSASSSRLSVVKDLHMAMLRTCRQGRARRERGSEQSRGPTPRASLTRRSPAGSPSRRPPCAAAIPASMARRQRICGPEMGRPHAGHARHHLPALPAAVATPFPCPPLVTKVAGTVKDYTPLEDAPPRSARPRFCRCQKRARTTFSSTPSPMRAASKREEKS